MHLIGHLLGGLAQFFGQRHDLPPPRFLVEERTLRDDAHQHLFQRHGLCAELQPVGVVGLGTAMLVLDRHGFPEPFRVLQGDALRVGPELDDVAVSAQAKPTADHLHPSGDEQAAAPFGLVCVMAAGVVELAFDGAAVLRPLLFQMDERPLAAAEAEVLDARQGQPVVRAGHQDSLSQVTPSGRVSATVTV